MAVRDEENRTDGLTVSRADADALMNAGDGEAALLYLYIRAHGGEPDLRKAADALHRSDRDIGQAAAKLRDLGILAGPGDGADRLTPAEELPVHESRDILERSREDPAFAELVASVQEAMGRTISSVELNKVFGMYSDLAMDPDAILMLIEYCREEAEKKGKKAPAFGFIERVAFAWHDRGLLTREAAREWLDSVEERKSRTEQVKEAIGLGGRVLATTDKLYIRQWLDMGFDTETIALAADRTAVRIGKVNLKYMDAIIQSWHQQGLHTVSAIEKLDRKPEKKRTATPAEAVRDESKTMEQIRKLRDRMNAEEG